MTSSKKKHVYESCLKEMEYEILCGQLSPRERLIEGDFMERFGVTRGTIRKVFKALEFKQLVRYLPNRGVIVAEATPKEMEDIFNLRVKLENYALETAVEKIDDQVLRQIEEHQISFENAVKGNKLKHILDSNVLFHQSVFRASDNLVLCDMIDQLRIRAHLWQHYLVGHPERLEESTNEHWIIIGCLKSRDSNRLKKINHKHIRRGYQCYLEDQDNRRSEK